MRRGGTPSDRSWPSLALPGDLLVNSNRERLCGNSPPGWALGNPFHSTVLGRGRRLQELSGCHRNHREVIWVGGGLVLETPDKASPRAQPGSRRRDPTDPKHAERSGDSRTSPKQQYRGPRTTEGGCHEFRLRMGSDDGTRGAQVPSIRFAGAAPVSSLGTPRARGTSGPMLAACATVLGRTVRCSLDPSSPERS